MNDVIVKDEVVIENLIYKIRGKQVMLGSDVVINFEDSYAKLERN